MCSKHFVLSVGQVTNKLYVINYISEDIEKFATNMLLSTMDKNMSDNMLSQLGETVQRTEREVCAIMPYIWLFCFLDLPVLDRLVI